MEVTQAAIPLINLLRTVPLDTQLINENNPAKDPISVGQLCAAAVAYIELLERQLKQEREHADAATLCFHNCAGVIMHAADIAKDQHLPSRHRP